MNELTVVAPVNNSIFANGENFELAQRICKALAASDIVPKNYQGNIPNTLIALELSNRIGASPLMVMQNLAIIHGKPSFSSTFLIAAINQSGKFSPLRFQVDGEGELKGCTAWATDLSGERLESPKVTMKMAKDEGWIDKPGSKWKTMPDIMLRYRAASFFSRLYCPEITMGMQSKEEVEDTPYQEIVATETKKSLLPDTPQFDRAKKHLANGGSIDEIISVFEVSQPVLDELLTPVKQEEPINTETAIETPKPNEVKEERKEAPIEKPKAEKKSREWQKPEDNV